MATYKYLIIGGGMTGDAAAKAIRERDPEGSIALVGAEQHAPYARPPLSKALWKGKDEDSIWRGTEEHEVDLKLGVANLLNSMQRGSRRRRIRGVNVAVA